MKQYRCWWADHKTDFFGSMEDILRNFKDLNPDEEEWFMWDYIGDARDHLPQEGDYVTGGGVTLNEFARDSKVYDKVECDNMTIKRVH